MHPILFFPLTFSFLADNCSHADRKFMLYVSRQSNEYDGIIWGFRFRALGIVECVLCRWATQNQVYGYLQVTCTVICSRSRDIADLTSFCSRLTVKQFVYNIFQVSRLFSCVQLFFFSFPCVTSYL